MAADEHGDFDATWSVRRRGPGVTIADIAREAAVSVGTVSHYVNGSAGVATRTGERIHDAMERLAYQPNLNARSLRARSTQALGLVLPTIINPYFAEVASLIGDHASANGYQVLLCSSGEDEARESEHLRNLHQRRVDGALVIVTGPMASQRVRESLPFPCVFLDREVAGKRSIATDNRLGGRLAMEHLLELGHRDIGLIVGDEHVSNIRERLAGVHEALDNWGVRIDEKHVLRGTQSIDTGRQAGRLWAMEHPPTALFATNDIIAIGAWQSCLAAGVRVPDDVSLIGFDDIHWARLTVPPLTTVRQDLPSMTGRALDELLAAIAGSSSLEPVTSLVAPAVIVRESTREPCTRLDPDRECLNT